MNIENTEPDKAAADALAQAAADKAAADALAQAAADKAAADALAVKPCRALDVGHRSCDCPDCSYNAPKK